MVVAFSFICMNHFSAKAAAKVKQFSWFLTTWMEKLVPKGRGTGLLGVELIFKSSPLNNEIKIIVLVKF